MALLMGHRPKPLLFNENTERAGTHETIPNYGRNYPRRTKRKI